jgi:hypothetical protein
MTATAVNTIIDQLVSDDALRHRVMHEGAPALAPFAIEHGEALALAEAVRADLGAEPFENLRRQARFEPLFAAASASATKIG